MIVKDFQEAADYHRYIFYFKAYDVKGQIQHDALQVSLSGLSDCVVLQLLTGDANIPRKGPA